MCSEVHLGDCNWQFKEQNRIDLEWKKKYPNAWHMVRVNSTFMGTFISVIYINVKSQFLLGLMVKSVWTTYVINNRDIFNKVCMSTLIPRCHLPKNMYRVWHICLTSMMLCLFVLNQTRGLLMFSLPFLFYSFLWRLPHEEGKILLLGTLQQTGTTMFQKCQPLN